MGHSSNRWLNARINVKHVARWDVASRRFDIFVAKEEHLSSTVCVYGRDQEAMNS